MRKTDKKRGSHMQTTALRIMSIFNTDSGKVERRGQIWEIKKQKGSKTIYLKPILIMIHSPKILNNKTAFQNWYDSFSPFWERSFF